MDIGFHSLGCMPQKGISGLNIFGNSQTLFQSDCTILQPQEQCIRITMSLYPLQHLFYLSLFLAILGCLVVWFAFSRWLMMLHFFSFAYWPLTRDLWRNIYSNSVSILKLGCLTFIFKLCNSLYILYIGLYVWLANRFS